MIECILSLLGMCKNSFNLIHKLIWALCLVNRCRIVSLSVFGFRKMTYTYNFTLLSYRFFINNELKKNNLKV